MVRLVALLAAGALLTGCEEDMGQSEWLRIENTTTERVYVQEGDDTGRDYLIGIGPGETEKFNHEVCDDSELVAHSASTDGPVVATHPPEEQGDCTGTWVIGPDLPPSPYWTSP